MCGCMCLNVYVSGNPHACEGLYAVKSTTKGHFDERTRSDLVLFLILVSYLSHVNQPVMMGHLSYRNIICAIQVWHED